MLLRSAKDQLRNRFGAVRCGGRSPRRVAAGADHRRGRGREYGEAQKLLADAERYLASREWELGRVERELVTLDE